MRHHGDPDVQASAVEGRDRSSCRIGFGNAAPGAKVCIQAFFTQYDTRHDINSQCYIRGCTTYFEWTRDINFLRRNIDRMRLALRYDMTEFDALDRKYIYNTWVGHDGRSGLIFDKDGKKQILSGHGIGDNYWDLIPFGCKDCYATMLYYEALNCMARIERDIREHPEWNVPNQRVGVRPGYAHQARGGGQGRGQQAVLEPQDRQVRAGDRHGRQDRTTTA